MNNIDSIIIIDGKALCEKCDKELIQVKDSLSDREKCPDCGKTFEFRYDQNLNLKIYSINLK